MANPNIVISDVDSLFSAGLEISSPEAATNWYRHRSSSLGRAQGNGHANPFFRKMLDGLSEVPCTHLAKCHSLSRGFRERPLGILKRSL